MAMNYEELDDPTKQQMLSEFEKEQAGGKPYQSKALSPAGLKAFPDLMREAIKSGNARYRLLVPSTASNSGSQRSYTLGRRSPAHVRETCLSLLRA